MKKPHQLTDLQLSILSVVWDRKAVTVAEVQKSLEPSHRLARKTVATLMTRLEQQGFLKHTTEGREFVYRAVVGRERVRQASLSSMVEKLFNGSAPALLSYALENSEMQPGDVDEAARLIAEWRKKRGKTK